MSKHTPGPWYRSGCTVYALNDRKSCNRFSVLVQDAHTPREELEAVAKLMQLAPDLLKALEKAAHAMWNCESNMDDEASELEIVIAKAKGDKP